jgi:NAD(P)-dependent dehydrogenase (short-subunit alcohol dehydrogenase family)
VVAEDAVREICQREGKAVAVASDITTPDGAKHILDAAIEAFGGLDVLVCNAGVYRVGWLWEQSLDDWDDMMRVHLRGMFCPAQAAILHWRTRFEAGEAIAPRLICTTSQSGLFGQPGSVPYDVAKAGVAGFVLAAANELSRYGICVNGIAPRAMTRMVEIAADALPRLGVPLVNQAKQAGQGVSNPEDIAGLAVWLGSVRSARVTGRVFAATRGEIKLVEGWSDGPVAAIDMRCDPQELGPIIDGLTSAQR